jgi:hypothetical protein
MHRGYGKRASGRLLAEESSGYLTGQVLHPSRGAVMS